MQKADYVNDIIIAQKTMFIKKGGKVHDDWSEQLRSIQYKCRL